MFIRAPEAGKVKTRLAAEIGPDAALRVYRRLAEHTLAVAAQVAGAGVEVRVHYTPADAGRDVRAWLEPAWRAREAPDGGGALRFLPQQGEGLGERMENAFAAAFEAGHERVVIVGSDLPALDAALVLRAFALLEASPAVLGPARDGGYYLMGLRQRVGGLFSGIPWSTSDVLRLTLDRLRDAGIEPALLEPLSDLDEASDLPPGWLDGS